MARFTLITFDRYNAEDSTTKHFQLAVGRLSIEAFEHCLLEQLSQDMDDDDYEEYLEYRQKAHASKPKMNKAGDLIGMDDETISYLFFIS